MFWVFIRIFIELNLRQFSQYFQLFFQIIYSGKTKHISNEKFFIIFCSASLDLRCLCCFSNKKVESTICYTEKIINLKMAQKFEIQKKKPLYSEI